MIVESNIRPSKSQHLQGKTLVNFNIEEKIHVDSGEIYYTYHQFSLPLDASQDDINTLIQEKSVIISAEMEALEVQKQQDAITLWKADRTTAVSRIEVEFNGDIFQGDETSQDRMSRTINALPDDTVQIPWITKDNSIVMLNKLNLQSILLLAGTEQSRIWNLGRPS